MIKGINGLKRSCVPFTAEHELYFKKKKIIFKKRNNDVTFESVLHPAEKLEVFSLY